MRDGLDLGGLTGLLDTTLALAAVLTDLSRDERSQVILATHSPVLAAIPGADVYEVGTHGLRRTTWTDLPMVHHWQRFLQDPDRYFRHLDDPA